MIHLCSSVQIVVVNMLESAGRERVRLLIDDVLMYMKSIGDLVLLACPNSSFEHVVQSWWNISIHTLYWSYWQLYGKSKT